MGVRAIRGRSSALVLIGAVVGTMLVGAPPAEAAQISVTVDSTEDQPDQDPGDGLCESDTAGCTLRAAIMEANAYGINDNTGGNDDVVAISLDGLAANDTIVLEITGELDAGSLDVEEGVTITTSVTGITVDASGLQANDDPDRVFEIDVTTADTPTVTIENLTITGGNSNDGLGGGGVFFGFSGDGLLTLRDVNIVGNTDGDYGGGLSIYDGTVVAARTVIDGNDAPEGGGVYVEDGNLTMIDSQVTNNFTTGNDAGGILMSSSSDDLTLTRTRVEENIAEGDGGGLFLDNGGRVVVSGGTISGNLAEFGAGGGIYATTDVEVLRLTNVNIENNEARDGEGGGIYVEHDVGIDSVPGVASHLAPVSITGGRIADNVADGSGGGLYLAAGVSLTAAGVEISRNIARFGTGGGIDVGGADTLVLTDVNLDDNNAESRSGGGIYVGSAGAVTLTRGRFARNRAVGNGGGLYLSSTVDTVNVNGTTLANNVARFNDATQANGGGLYAEGSTTLDIRNATFDGNRAGAVANLTDPVGPEGSGGALYLATHVNGSSEPAITTIRTSTFRNNGARFRGGAIATEFNGVLTVIGSLFASNRAGVNPVLPGSDLLGIGQGGALDLEGGTVATASAVGSTLTRFVGNRAGGPGGAIHAGGSQLTTRDVQFDDNVAGSAGGGVLLTGPDAVAASFTRGRFLRNVASLRGGGVAASSEEATVAVAFTNVLIDSNRANEGGGVHTGDNVDAEISGGAVRRNTATDGAGGGLRALDRLELTNALVEFNTASTSGGGIASSSPLFVSTSTIADNDAQSGGGLVVTAGSAFITRSTFARNDASSSGGGIHVAGQGFAAIELSTVTANAAPLGAGIRTLGDLTLVRTTITFNVSPPSGGASLVVSAGAEATLDHTLIACQEENACIFASGTVVSRGHNMTDDPDCLIPGAPSTDRVVLHELIGLNGLQDNGGPTDTHSVRPESLAIDHGARRCPPSPITEAILTVDQRGFPGLVDGDGNGTARCDAGSYEYSQGVLITRSATADEAGPVDGFVELRRSGDLSAPLTVRYEVGGSATPGADYERLSGSVRFPAGDSFVRIRVRPVADDLLEATETVTVALVHSSAYSLGLRTFATVPILDAAGAVTIRATDPIASEVGPDPGTFTIRRTGSLDSALEVFLEFGGSAVQGTDYPLTRTSVTLPAGASTAVLTITPLDDDVADPGETIIATIEEHPDYRIGAPRAAQITIGDASAGLVRYAGEDRKETAIEVARANWPDGGAAAVVLARADLYPDALAGGPFASLVEAPMLLTDTAELDPLVAAEIDRLGVSKVYLLGQTAALSEDVEEALLELGLEVERIGGEDRFETAALIAARVVGNGTLVYITEGLDLDPARGWPDAVSVAPLAAYEGRPILLVTTDEVPEHTFTALSNLGFTQARIIGGPAAVSADVEEALEGLALEVERYAGDDRYETSRAVVDLELAVGMDPRRLWLATGAKFPDALVAGPAVAAERGVLLLTPQDDLDRAPTTRDFIADLDPSGLLIRLVGGPAAISERVEQQIRALVGL